MYIIHTKKNICFFWLNKTLYLFNRISNSPLSVCTKSCGANNTIYYLNSIRDQIRIWKSISLLRFTVTICNVFMYVFNICYRKTCQPIAKQVSGRRYKMSSSKLLNWDKLRAVNSLDTRLNALLKLTFFGGQCLTKFKTSDW